MRPLGPAETAIATGVVLASAFLALEALVFAPSTRDASEWRHMLPTDRASYTCDGRPNCYPDPSDATRCGRPFTCPLQTIENDDQAHCMVNETVWQRGAPGDLVFVLKAPEDKYRGSRSREETIHRTASQISDYYGKKLIVLVDEDEAVDLCKLKYDNLEVRCAPFKKGGRKFMCGGVHCSSEHGYVCELEKIIAAHSAVLFMRVPLGLNHPKHGDLIETLRAYKKPLVTIGGAKMNSPQTSHFASFFPGEIPPTTRAFEALYIERAGWEQLKWAKQFLFEAVYGREHITQHDIFLHLVEKIKADHGFPHIYRPDSLSGPVPAPSGMEIFRAFYISLVIFVMFITYAWSYGNVHFKEDVPARRR